MMCDGGVFVGQHMLFDDVVCDDTVCHGQESVYQTMIENRSPVYATRRCGERRKMYAKDVSK